MLFDVLFYDVLSYNALLCKVLLCDFFCVMYVFDVLCGYAM